MLMRVFSIFVTFICLLVVVACTKDIGPNPDLVKTNFCDTISFSKHIKPIIQANCVSCHKAGGFAASYADFDTDMYPVLKTKADNGTLRGRAVDLTITPTMPYGSPPLPEETRNILKCWIEAGAPNN
jgi:uncharacterized membrane protein